MSEIKDTTRESITSDDFEDKVTEVIRHYLSTSGFSDIKLTDTPKDAHQIVPRNFVTANGSTGSRPTSPVTGQFFYDLSVGKPIWWNGSNWKDANGNTV